MEAFHLLTETEGILPALESAHAVAYAVRAARSMPGKILVVIYPAAGQGP